MARARSEVPHLYYPRMNQTRIINPHAFPGGGGGGTTFGNASREFDYINDYIDLGDLANLGTTDYSVAAWVSPGSLSPSFTAVFCTSETLIGGAALNKWGLTIRPSLNLARIYHETITINFSATWTANSWRHICYSADRDGNLVVYLDGSSVSTTAISATDGNNITGDGPLTISKNDSYRFEGRIADVRLYHRLISGSEAADLASGTDIDSTGLEGWWITDADDVLDYSGNGNDGTNNGSTYSTDGPLD